MFVVKKVVGQDDGSKAMDDKVIKVWKGEGQEKTARSAASEGA